MEGILKGSIFVVLFFDIHSNAVLPFKIIDYEPISSHRQS